jgi:hypothetical protein
MVIEHIIKEMTNAITVDSMVTGKYFYTFLFNITKIRKSECRSAGSRGGRGGDRGRRDFDRRDFRGRDNRRPYDRISISRRYSSGSSKNHRLADKTGR